MVPNSSMLNRDHTIAIYMEGSLRSLHGKMGFGIMRYFPGQIACIIDATFAGRRIDEVITSPCEAPIVATIEEACTLGAQVLVLGTAPSGGRIPPEWLGSLETAINNGLSIVNGMHDRLKDRFGTLESEDQWIWDIRHPESFVPSIASGRARTLTNKRVLLTGTDMAVGKMTTGLEIYHWLLAKEQSTVFLATGQIGMAITGNGIPLDAFKVDHACGAVLDVIEEEDLIENVNSVGKYLKDKVNNFVNKYEMVGDVRGQGLFIGIECIQGNENSEPNKELAIEFVEKMKQKGFLISNAGQFRNVLKIRPPLVFQKEHADLLCEVLEETLDEFHT